ncbi:MAG: CdaR family protein [Myxococcota bacterium]
MADLWQRFVAWITYDPFTKGLALLLAVTAWLFVQQDVARETPVPMRVRWVLPDGLVTTEPLRNQVTVVVEGARAATSRARTAGVEQRIDLTGLPMGEHVVDLSSIDWSVPESLTVLGVEPSTVALELDERIQQKVQVKPRPVGDPPPAYEIRGLTIEPEVIDVEGPRKVLSRLDHVFTKPIDLSSLTDAVTVDAPLDLPWGVQTLNDEVPQAMVDVVVVTRTVEDLSVPVIIYDDYGYVPEPTTVTVSLRGPAAILDGLGESAVVAFVRLPKGAPATAEARYGAQRGPRIEIWRPGGSEVAVTRVQPQSVRVERR